MTVRFIVRRITSRDMRNGLFFIHDTKLNSDFPTKFMMRDTAQRRADDFNSGEMLAPQK